MDILRIGDRVVTIDCKGVIKKIEDYDTVRLGIIPDEWPHQFDGSCFLDGLLYFLPKEVQKLPPEGNALEIIGNYSQH